ncbi:lipopolysaccharide transport periplasmic protein LptA [Massilia cavernae]|uniref:Lipopolysaccharide export system protein LptA n=1 Tax=Massilia cavernae TaxID=2320864 RepID=A0A418XDR9_9BURK|nr:lipopolysaccharide transport periplasmic protein LptA [Massilia cavernae]RJG10671.1 lipopolysaccharide transport periplasmic protein LptA [Massilia cavernae]
MKKLLLFIALCGLVAGTALAEKADSYKPIVIDSDSVDIDDVKQITTLTGNVVLTRGTLLMKAAKATVRTDAEGYDHVVFNAAPGGVATFRQKRDGGDLWVEGEAERIEYDNKSEVVKLFSKARLAQLAGKKVTEEIVGEFVSYDSRRELFKAANSPTGESKPGGGRVRTVLDRSAKRVSPAPATPGQ